jgi:hypothetical protein
MKSLMQALQLRLAPAVKRLVQREPISLPVFLESEVASLAGNPPFQSE